MPLPRGVDPEFAVVGYVDALSGFTIEAITAGIRKFLRGDCENADMKFCPRPPELATIIRKAVYAPKPSTTFGADRALYRYKPPRSKIIEGGITKEYAFNLIDIGVHPRGSIWCPGQLNDKPEVGDLFGPDGAWQPAVPL